MSDPEIEQLDAELTSLYLKIKEITVQLKCKIKLASDQAAALLKLKLGEELRD